MPSIAKTFDEIIKFNPYHGRDGRFASANGATSFTFRTKDPGKQHLANNAIAREKERTAAAGSGSDTPRMKAIHSVEDKIRGQFYETAAVVDTTGKILFKKDGSEGQVGFTKAECKLMKDNTLTHNHPRSSIFSMEDTLCFAQNDMLEMRATTREGITYSMKRGEGYTKDKGLRFVIDYEGEYKAALRVAQMDLDRRFFYEKIMNGEITKDQANVEFGKVVAKEMVGYCNKHASRYGIDFSVEKRSVKAKNNIEVYSAKSADKEEHEIILDKGTDEMTDAAFNEWMNKSEEVGKSFNVYKVDSDKRFVFGWASVSITVEGEQLEDRQKDMIDPDVLEEAAYDYVLHFRDTGEEHISTMRKKGKLVESCVFTAEKQKAMGIPEGILPIGWWIGFKIDDDDAWERVKNGTYKMFSIEGKAEREPVEKAAPVAKTFNEVLEEIEKFNPYHGRDGRFATAGGATSFTYKPGASRAHDLAIQREKERTAAMAAAAKPKFTPAKTKKEAVQYAKDNLGFMRVSYGTKLGMDAINLINEEITNVQAKYPEVKGAVHELKTTTARGVYAQIRYSGLGGMTFEVGSNQFGGRLDMVKERYKRDVESGFHPKGTEANSIIHHEYGHVLECISTKKSLGYGPSDTLRFEDNRPFVAEMRLSQQTSGQWIQQAAKECNTTNIGVMKRISRYAMKNTRETFAEAFAEYQCSENPRPEAVAMVKASGWAR